MEQEDLTFTHKVNSQSALVTIRDVQGEHLEDVVALEEVSKLTTESGQIEETIRADDETPMPRGNAESTANGNEKHPLDLTLQENWMKVFEWLTDSDDLSNCMNSCATFHTLLKEKRTSFLFSQVFRVVAENTSEKKKDHVDMLVARAVCKSWKQSVDSLYQNLPFLSEVDYYAFHEETLKCISAFLCRVWNDPFSIDFELSPRGLSELKRKYAIWSESGGSNHVNPFPSRHLAIYDSEDTLRDDEEGLLQNMEAKEKITEVLQNFGHHVWYFTVLLHMGVPSQRYLMLLQWLKFIPNLKSLSLYFRPGDGDFTETVEQFPFPEKSELLVFQGDKVPNVLLKSILKANPQIEMVQNQGVPSQTPFPQPKLSEMRMHTVIAISQKEMDTAKYSKLENLSIDFHVAADEPATFRHSSLYSCKSTTAGESRSTEIQLWERDHANITVFTMLERFGSTLVHLRLGLADQLKIPKGTFSFSSLCIDLILPLRAWNLKSLHVSAKCRDGYRWMDKKDVAGQLYTYLDGRLQESKIWKLPEVKQIFVVNGCDGVLTLFV